MLPTNCVPTTSFSAAMWYLNASATISLKVPAIALRFTYSNRRATQADPPSVPALSQYLVGVPVLSTLALLGPPQVSDINTAQVPSMLLGQ